MYLSKSTYQERRDRVDAISERTGKPHYYVYQWQGTRNSTWLFANYRSLSEMSPEQANATWDYLDHLDEVYGFES